MIAEQRIRDAMDDGLFDDLPGKGKPLDLDDETSVPQDMKMAFKILKNADMLPPELELQQEVRDLQVLIAQCIDDGEARSLQKKLTLKQLKLELTLEKYGRTLPTAYAGRVQAKLSERSVSDA
jgi:hypothetical protein